MKQLLNRPEDVVLESLEGLTSTTPFLSLLDGFPSIKVVYNTKHDGDNTVAIISGGGSGHEPAFAGYVGTGMLAAAIAGDVFAAPPEDAVLAAIRQVTGKRGALIVFNNYTGDRLCFGAAAERAKAEGYDVAISVVADDCALKNKTSLGRRGLAGSVLAMKAAGAAAAQGASLARCKAVADRAAASIGTMGCTLSVCNIPGQPTTTPLDAQGTKGRLAEDELEMGLGLHGEPGAYKQKIKPVDRLVDELVFHVAGEPESYLPLARGTPVALLVNNLGAATCLEMGVITRAAIRAAAGGLGLDIKRTYAGTFMSSLDMRGFSVTLMKLDGSEGEDGIDIHKRGDGVAISCVEWLLRLLDAPTEAVAWPKSSGTGPFDPEKKATPLPSGRADAANSASAAGDARSGTSPVSYNMELLSKRICAACAALIDGAGRLNELDATIGDGDCGATLAKGATAVMQALMQGTLQLGDPHEMAMAVAALLGRTMGGTSGGVLKIFFTAMGAELQAGGYDVARAMKAGVHAVSTYGGAVLGDRTMLDALGPAVEAFASSGGSLSAASDAAKVGAEATKGMVAGAGRSSYVPLDVVKGVPDPGAVAVSIVLEAMASVCFEIGQRF